MTHALWPLLDLRVTTGDLELRIPRRGGAAQLASYRWWMSARASFAPEGVDAQGWRARPRPSVSVEGLEGCLAPFGAAG